jgi:signal transduction histidine kinase
LAIAQRLAKVLGGRIDVASEEGRGSVFTLTVDATLSPVEHRANESAQPVAP